jgi:hypothetical protein
MNKIKKFLGYKPSEKVDVMNDIVGPFIMAALIVYLPLILAAIV